MADITYTVNQDDPNSIDGFEQFSQADKNLIGTFEVNNLFDSSKNLAELHILSLADTLLESHYNYSNYKLLGNAQSAGKSGASILSIDPIEDSKLYGYQYGGVKLLYHFLNDLYTDKKERIPFYIESISPDRTELRLQSLDLSNDDIKSYTQAVKDKLGNQSYFNEFRLNFDNNDLFIGINIDVIESNGNSYVAVKLYEPLPTTYDLKSITYINEIISDSVAFEVDSVPVPEVITAQSLRSPNFNLEVVDNSVVPTGYYSYNDLFSYPVNNTNSQIFSLYNEKGAEISIDHTDYSDFIHFSSAYERLVNFKYKLQLIEGYSSSLAQINTAASQSAGTTGSNTYYKNQIEGVVNNFDHYERFLYYESSSYAWPKTNTTRPYINAVSTTPLALNWYANQLATANGYDLSNGNLLINSIPSFLRDDPNNENYLTFIYMIGQHFDNLWIYGKAVTDKYDADNRLDFGISKDLVGEALKNFGVKLYTSNNSIQDLFGSLIGQAYQSGSEKINYYITGSLTGSNTPIQPSSYDNYNKEVQKRIYHNLSHLIKTKGTERGLRALINCFGIPSDILKIKLYGGRNTDERPFYGDFQYYTSSLGKIRLDNTGSLVTGSTLSPYTSTYKRDTKYTDDLHNIEIGFSPTDNVDNYIVSASKATASLASFNIDDYIGDPRNLTLDSYALLDNTGTVVDTLTNLTNRIMSGSTAYDVFDYVRLIKFFDNTIFKMVRDFIPARVTADTGIIIKPHLLQRNKAKSVLLSGSRPELSGSIDTAFTSASNGDTFGSRDQYTTVTLLNPDNPSTNSRIIQTPLGLGLDFRHGHEETKFDGDFSGSNITVTNGNLNQANQYTTQIFTTLSYDIALVSGSVIVCLLQPAPTQIRIEPFQSYESSTFFGGVQENTTYKAAIQGGSTITIPGFSYIFTDTNFQQYQIITLQATGSGIADCQKSTKAMYASCSIQTTEFIPSILVKGNSYDLRNWFTPVNANINYFVNGLQINSPYTYTFNGTSGDYFTITARDTTIESSTDVPGLTCNIPVTIQQNAGCPITLPTSQTGIIANRYIFNDVTSFEYTEQVITNPPGSIKRYKVGRYQGVTPTKIKSLFATGQNDPTTRYAVRIKYVLVNNPYYVVPGLNPLANPFTEATYWNGNEVLELNSSPLANSFDDGLGRDRNWDWFISGETGKFSGDEYSNIWKRYSNVNGVSDGDLGSDWRELAGIQYLEVIALNTNSEFGGTCQQIVRITPVGRSTTQTGCREGFEYTCDYTVRENEPIMVTYIGYGQNACLGLDPCN